MTTWAPGLRVVAVTGAVLVAAVGCSSGGDGASPATTSTTPRAAALRVPEAVFSTSPCPSELASHPRITCGTLQVQDRVHGRAWASTRLAVATVHASSKDPKPDPIVYLHGGPNGSAVTDAATIFENSPLSVDRDVIVVDQRGGGLSQPSVTCPPVDQAALATSLGKPSSDPTVWQPIKEAIQTCQRSLAKAGKDPAGMTTAAIAADIAALRVALKIDRWNVLAYSFGGRVALVMLRDHPQGIRSMVLDAPLPIDRSALDGARMKGGLDALFAACDASASCRARHPDLKGEWVAELNRLEARPVTISVPAANGQPAATVRLDGSRAVLGMLIPLADPAQIAGLPDLIGDPPALEKMLASLTARLTLGYQPDGATLSILCAEDRSIRSTVTSSPETLDFPARSVSGHSCDGWQTKPQPASDRAFPDHRVPTLVLHGQYDPLVVRQWASATAKRLGAPYVEFAGRSHGSTTVGFPCGEGVAAAFFDDPAATPDTICNVPQPLK